MGFKNHYPTKEQFPNHQVMYTFNHNAFLDIFLLTGLGLPNLKFILSESTWFYLPVVISALAAGTLYIPQKHYPNRRLRFFKRATNFFKKTKFSVAASSEGVHKHFHGIAPFNRGIYHMAMEAGIPIVLLYINIPLEHNMFKFSYAKNGTINIEILDEIETKDWTLEHLDEQIDHIRNIYVSRFNELNPNTPTI